MTGLRDAGAQEDRADSIETNVAAQAVSNAAGNYEIPFLLPDTNQVTAEATGFNGFQRGGIEVRTSDRMVVWFVCWLAGEGQNAGSRRRVRPGNSI